MTYAYVVTEGVQDTKILTKLLPEELVNHTEFAEGTNRYGVYSLSGTLLAIERLPVAVVMDADTEDAKVVQEQEDFLHELLQRSATKPESRYQIFIAVPTLEIVFFRDKTLLEQLTDRKLSETEWILARHAPKQFFNLLPGGHQKVVARILQNLTDDQLSSLRNDPLIRDLISFLASAIPQQV